MIAEDCAGARPPEPRVGRAPAQWFASQPCSGLATRRRKLVTSFNPWIIMKRSNGSQREGAVEQTRGGAPSAPSPVTTGETPAARCSGVVACSAERPRGPWAPPDEEAPCTFRTAYRGTWRFVLEASLRRLKRWVDPSVAEDIVQNVYLKLRLITGAPGNFVPRPLRTVLLGLVDNEVRSQCRSVARRRVDGEPDPEVTAASTLDPEQHCLACEARVRNQWVVELILREMHPEAAALIRMFHIDELTVKQMAERLGGISEEAAAARLKRARAHFVETRDRVLTRLRRAGRME